MLPTGKLYDCCMHPLETWGGLRRRRARLIPPASGRVLEIGAGSGANLPYFRKSRIETLDLLDLSLSRTLKKRSEASPLRPRLHEGDAQALPFADATFDTVVFTLVFCSVPDPLLGLREVRRVLRPGGQVRFMEHGLPPDRPRLAGCLRLLTPCWRPLTGGCHLDRRPLDHLTAAGFSLHNPERFGRGLLAMGLATTSATLPPPEPE